MSKMDKIASKLQDHYDILDFLYKNYPNILDEWKSGLREPTPNPTDADEHPKVQLRNVQREFS